MSTPAPTDICPCADACIDTRARRPIAIVLMTILFMVVSLVWFVELMGSKDFNSGKPQERLPMT
jgi:hypothetical protein